MLTIYLSYSRAGYISDISVNGLALLITNYGKYYDDYSLFYSYIPII